MLAAMKPLALAFLSAVALSCNWGARAPAAATPLAAPVPSVSTIAVRTPSPVPRGDAATPSALGKLAMEQLPSGRLAFAAGGSIYTVSPDGTGLREVIPGNRQEESPPSGLPYTAWNAAPAFSPDGSHLLFTRDFDLWMATANGEGVRLLADVGNWDPSWGASNPSLGAQNVAWSPDGQFIMYVLSRIGGSGYTQVWAMQADGSGQQIVHRDSAFLLPTWLDGSSIAFLHGRVTIPTYAWPESPQEAPVSPSSERRLKVAAYGWPDGIERQALLIPGVDTPWPGLLEVAASGDWLLGSFVREAPILFGKPDSLKQLAEGVSPTLSPDGGWIAYFQGDRLRVAKVDGSADWQVVDLVPLGGRDRHFASACGLRDRLPGCGHRPPVISWAVAEQ